MIMIIMLIYNLIIDLAPTARSLAMVNKKYLNNSLYNIWGTLLFCYIISSIAIKDCFLAIIMLMYKIVMDLALKIK